MLSVRKIAVSVMFALILGVVVSGLAMAADQKQEFGTIDLEKAFDSYDKKVQLENDLAGEVAKVQKSFDLHKNNYLLTDDDFNQLSALATKDKPSDDEQKKIDALKATEKQLELEFTALQQKTAPTDTDKTRFNELNGRAEKVKTTLTDEIKKKEDEFNKKRVSLSQEIMTDVNTVVSTVAKEKNLSMVFNKSAVGDQTLVIYSNNDITDEVIKRLNKKK